MANTALEGIIAMLRAGELSLTEAPTIARPIFEAMFTEVPRPEGVSILPGIVGGVSGLWLKPEGAPIDKVILYVHGGAYVIGSAAAYVTVAGGLAQACGFNMFMPDYRLAPEHPYPAASDDVLACYRALLGDTHPEMQGDTHGLQRDTHFKIIVAGDSAGGGLVMSLLLNSRQNQLAQPCCAILWSPWLDLYCELPSITRNAAHDPTLDIDGLLASVHHYVGDSVPDEECLHPLSADLTGLAPLLIQVGSIEILLDDSIALAANAALHHTHCQLEIWPGMPHVFQGFAPALPEATQALQNCRHFVGQFL